MILATLLLRGEPHEALAAAALENQCDLVVIGKRGYNLPPGDHMGKVTERVIGYCPTDVLVVPVRGALGLDRLLLPVDGSRCSRRAVTRALSLAGPDASLLAVAVLDAPPGFVEDAPEAARDLLQSLERLVAEVAAGAGGRGIPCQTRVAVGPASRTIVDLAAAWQAGLIVMGSHGRTGLKAPPHGQRHRKGGGAGPLSGPGGEGGNLTWRSGPAPPVVRPPVLPLDSCYSSLVTAPVVISPQICRITRLVFPQVLASLAEDD